MDVAQMIRKQFGEADDRRDQGVKDNEQVVSYLDLTYGSHPDQTLNLYRPKQKDLDEPLPVIISVHGGGWVYGDKERYHYFCQSLAEKDFAVVNFSYRLAPEHQFPASLEDLIAVCQWLLANHETYHLDLTQVFATGDSAGAHLLGIFVNGLTNPQYAHQFDFDFPSLKIKATALFCGAYEIAEDSDDLTKSLMDAFLPNGGDSQELDMINVLTHLTSDFPTSFVATANQDFLRQDTLKLLAVLAEQEVAFEAHCYGDKAHPLKHVFHLNVRTAEGLAAREEMLAFFRKHL